MEHCLAGFLCLLLGRTSFSPRQHPQPRLRLPPVRDSSRIWLLLGAVMVAGGWWLCRER